MLSRVDWPVYPRVKRTMLNSSRSRKPSARSESDNLLKSFACIVLHWD
jgi:hypothetical protein